jgi:Photosynthesis system II assembly factor YCF48
MSTKKWAWMKYPLLLLLLCAIPRTPARAQSLQALARQGHCSLRGMSVVTDKILWVSGSEGTVGRSTDGGSTWQWIKVKGYEHRDFRAIEAFDAKEAIIMAVSEPAVILKTRNGGAHWYSVFVDSTKGMFLDAMDFSNARCGVVIGDPLNNRAFIALTKDGGESWTVLDSVHATAPPLLEQGEGFFAASGTNIKLISQDPNRPAMYFVSGGMQSRLFLYGPKPVHLPLALIKGRSSTGAFSLDLYNNKYGVIVGGDYLTDSLNSGNCLLFSQDDSPQIRAPQTPPGGFRSCVAYVSASRLICCGSSGVDLSSDGGLNWQPLSKEGFNVCRKAKKGSIVYLAGSNGKVARCNW